MWKSGFHQDNRSQILMVPLSCIFCMNRVLVLVLNAFFGISSTISSKHGGALSSASSRARVPADNPV